MTVPFTIGMPVILMIMEEIPFTQKVDNYSYSHDVLDFVNRKLNMAFPGNNLWVVCFDFDYVSIYNLDTLSHMKRY